LVEEECFKANLVRMMFTEDWRVANGLLRTGPTLHSLTTVPLHHHRNHPHFSKRG
jgi:hypothetical protein